MELILFDDEAARSWAPLTTVRPAGELRFGGHTFRRRAERFAGCPCSGHALGGALAAFDEPDAPPGIDSASLEPADHGRLFFSSRAVPHPAAHFVEPSRSGVVRVAGHAAGWYVAAGDPPPTPDQFRTPESSETPTVATAEGRLIDRVWQLIRESPEQTAADIAAEPPGKRSKPPAGVHVIGDPTRLHMAPDATVEPGVVLDVREGEIRLDAGVSVRAFTRLAGPSWIGTGSVLLGGRFEAVSIGPVCKIHGEVEESVFTGWSNKAHDGFLGHAYVGQWVNLGAFTTNSDLKNNYGTIRIWTPNGEIDTGEIKLGCLLGDHVKTGIGVLLNTGTVVGTGSNIYGSDQPPKHVPAFSWGTGQDLVRFRLDRFLEVAERAMGRRDVALMPGVRSILEAAWKAGS